MVLNGLVLAAIAWVASRVQADWAAEHVQGYQQVFAEAMAEVRLREALVAPGGSLEDPEALRLMLGLHRSRHLFRDVVVTGGDERGSGALELNLFGAVDRDPSRFPRTEILRGLSEAQRERVVVPVGEGYCTPLVEGDEVLGAVWYTLQFPPPPPRLPLSTVIAVVALGVAILALITWWVLGRTVVLPIRRINHAALGLGASGAAVRVPELSAARELEQLGAAFNRMAERVEGHQAELRREVDAAVEATRRRERALVLSSRLASIGTLAAGIAHEINNPIGGMQNAVHRLLQQGDRPDRERRYLELVRDGLERVRRIARRVLDFSPKSLQPAPFEIAAAVEGARALVEHRLDAARVTLDVELEDELPAVLGDRHEMQQVLLNLFLNSVDALTDAATPSGRIRVVARRLDSGESVPRVQVSVADNGPGMDPELLDRVLDPFYSNKGRPDASGLGMFIAYNIIESHGGSLELRSQPGEGFETTLVLPAAAPGAAPDPPGS